MMWLRLEEVADDLELTRLDRLLLHRVAEATIRSFMRRLAESLADTVADE